MSKSLFRLAYERDPVALRRWFDGLPRAQQLAFEYDWSVFGRPEQQTPPGAWLTWLAMAGRGWGKTRTGAEFSVDEARRLPASRGALVGATGADVWDVMVHGESGIIKSSPPWFMPRPYKRSLIWPNGTIATAYSAEEPDRLRGPQHHWFWADELAAWQYPDTWDMLMMGLRLGAHPRGIVTTTPRPTPEIKALVADKGHTVITGGSTYDNEDNLPSAFLHKILSRYEGTRLGDQEIYAKILGDTPGALWKMSQIEALRVREHPLLTRIAVAIDPAVSTKEGSAETGIMVGGVGECDCKGRKEIHGFLLEDVTGRRAHEDEPVHLSPLEWGTASVRAFHKWRAHRMLAETNNGGNLVISNIESIDPTVHPFEINASDGKRTRAEPVAGLAEQSKIHHVGRFPELELQMTTWDALRKGERSPDRVDAYVWLFSYLMLAVEDLSLPSRPVIPWAQGRRLYR